MRRLDKRNFAEWAEDLRRPFQADYFAMYSSVYEGIVIDPVLMLVPVDDHLVHRGDGVFESLRCVEGSLYNLGAHLERLAESAKAMSLRLPGGRSGVEQAIVETVRAGGRRDCLVRVLVSRGSGSFGASPYDCPAPQLYVVAAQTPVPFMQAHRGGASLKSSSMPVKQPMFAAAKNCNYLPNALMKKEAVDAGVDFVVGFGEDGRLGEGATESVGIVTADNRLLFPAPGRILRGTTMVRLVELAQDLVREGALADAALRPIPRKEVARAPEILIAGTTVDVTAVTSYDGAPVGGGVPGPVYQRLRDLLDADMRTNAGLRTRVF